jgi:hypothetical protein
MLAETLYFKPRRFPGAPGSSIQEPLLVNYARSFFPVVLIVLVVRSFLFEPFRIPSASMMPNLVDATLFSSQNIPTACDCRSSIRKFSRQANLTAVMSSCSACQEIHQFITSSASSAYRVITYSSAIIA